jgi:membrane-associated phospholipid phosphatase
MQNINKLFYGVIALWGILAIVFGFFDLEISKYANLYKDSAIFEFGNKYGDQVDEPLFYVGITILLGSIFNDIKMQRKIGIVMIFYSIVNLEFVLLSANGYYETDGIFASYMILIFLSIFLILTYNQNWRNYTLIGISIVLLFIFTNIIVDLMKAEWGRVRFKDLSSDSDFTPWYVINGSNGNESFPSGHTSSAFTFLPLLILTKNKNMSNKIKAILIISVIGFGVYVALGRVFNGHHYASDVLFSAGICSILTFGFYKLFQNWKFNPIFNIQTIHNDVSEIYYSDLTKQWLGYHYNKSGRKIWKWFDTHEEALKHTTNLKKGL